jgi:hypothetical protein
MPEEAVTERAREDKRQGKASSTQAGEFVREEMEHIRKGKHGARSPQQAIAIGLSKARRAGVALSAPKATSVKTRAQAHCKRANVCREKTFQGALAGNFRGTEERREIGGVVRESIPAGQVCCAAAWPQCAAPICHEGGSREEKGRPESCADAQRIEV